MLNKNKNPTAEIAVKETQKEILRLKNATGPITASELNLVLKNIKSRIGFNSYTPRRNNLTNKDIDDKFILDTQAHNRKQLSEYGEKHKSMFQQKTPSQNINIGHSVILQGHSKIHSSSKTH